MEREVQKPDVVVTLVSADGEEVLAVIPGVADPYLQWPIETWTEYQTWLQKFLEYYAEIGEVAIDDDTKIVVYKRK